MLFSNINSCVCFQIDLKADAKNEGCIKQTSSTFLISERIFYPVLKKI